MKICSIIRSGEDAPVLVAVERQRSEDEFAGTVRKNLDGDFWWFSSEATQISWHVRTGKLHFYTFVFNFQGKWFTFLLEK